MQELSDEEEMREQEEEVKRLQAQQAAGLADEDFGLPSSSSVKQQAGQTMADLAAAGGTAAGAVQVETVEKVLGALTSEEQLAVVMADAPELLTLLEELKGCLAEVRSRVAPLLREVSSGGLATADGLSYLEAKHLLLLQYCMCIVAYLMLKAEGRSVKDHPVIARWGVWLSRALSNESLVNRATRFWQSSCVSTSTGVWGFARWQPTTLCTGRLCWVLCLTTRLPGS